MAQITQWLLACMLPHATSWPVTFTVFPQLQGLIDGWHHMFTTGYCLILVMLPLSRLRANMSLAIISPATTCYGSPTSLAMPCFVARPSLPLARCPHHTATSGLTGGGGGGGGWHQHHTSPAAREPLIACCHVSPAAVA